MEVNGKYLHLDIHWNYCTHVVALNLVAIVDQDPEWVRWFGLKAQSLDQMSLNKIVGVSISMTTSRPKTWPTKCKVSSAKWPDNV